MFRLITRIFGIVAFLALSGLSAQSQDVVWPVGDLNTSEWHLGPCGDWSETDGCIWLSAKSKDTTAVWRDSNRFQARPMPPGVGLPASIVGQYHLGADLNLGSGGDDKGQSVRSIADGRISKVIDDPIGNWGNILFIEHNFPGGTHTSMYAHIEWLASGKPTKGDNVEKSEPIGAVGNGNGNWPYHLHFELRKGSNVMRGGGYSPAQLTEGPQGQVDFTEFLTAIKNATTSQTTLVGTPNRLVVETFNEYGHFRIGSSLEAVTSIEVISEDPERWSADAALTKMRPIPKGQVVTLKRTKLILKGTYLKSDFIFFGEYNGKCWTKYHDNLSSDCGLMSGLSEAVQQDTLGDNELWGEIKVDGDILGWVLLNSSHVKLEDQWISNAILFDRIYQIIDDTYGVTWGDARNPHRPEVTDSMREQILREIAGLVSRGGSFNSLISAPTDSFDLAVVAIAARDIDLLDGLESLGFDYKSKQFCKDMSRAVDSMLSTDFSDQTVSYLSQLADRKIDLSCKGSIDSDGLGGLVFVAVNFEPPIDTIESAAESLLKLGASFHTKGSGQNATAMEILNQGFFQRKQYGRDLKSQLEPLVAQERKEIVAKERERIAGAKRQAETQSIIEWENALASKAPWPNTADLMRYDPARVASLLSKGHKIVFTVNTIGFTSGKVVASGDQLFTDIYAGIEKSELQKLNEEFSWDGWSAAINEITEDRGPTGYNFSCRVSAKKGAQLKEGAAFIFDAKLITMAGSQAVFDCDTDGAAP